MENKKYGVIYKYTFDNGKSYIGQTVNLHERIKSHKRCIDSGYYFANALKKYGFDETKFEIIKDPKDIVLDKITKVPLKKFFLIIMQVIVLGSIYLALITK